jgi:hypothetical protein
MKMTPGGRQDQTAIGRHVTHALRGFDVVRLDLLREAIEFKEVDDLVYKGAAKSLSQWYEDILTVEKRCCSGDIGSKPKT